MKTCLRCAGLVFPYADGWGTAYHCPSCGVYWDFGPGKDRTLWQELKPEMSPANPHGNHPPLYLYNHLTTKHIEGEFSID